jgi:hypothetical protein
MIFFDMPLRAVAKSASLAKGAKLKMSSINSCREDKFVAPAILISSIRIVE